MFKKKISGRSAVEAWIRVNQAGYIPNHPKTAVVLSNVNLQGTGWNLKKDGNTVLSGSLSQGKPGDNFYVKQAYAYKIDFSGINVIGTYTLELPNIKTEQVLVHKDPYSLFASQALLHLRTVRSGGEARLHAPSHLGDGRAIVYNVKGNWKNGKWEEASPQRTVDMQGGHYDAGDYIKFTLTEGNLAWHLLTAYHENPSLFVKTKDASALPDILDEAKYSLDYLAKTFPDTNTFVIQVGNEEDHNQGWRLPENDTLNGKRPALCALSRAHMGIAAAALALGASVFKNFDAEAALLYENKAKAIYSRAGQSDTQASAFERAKANDFYYDDTDTDNMALAVAELYGLTKEEKYLNDAASYPAPAWDYVHWDAYNAFANYRLAELGNNTDAKNRLLQEVKNYEKDNIYNIPSGYSWGALHSWIGMANAHFFAKRLEGVKVPSVPFMGVLQYVFGCNNWGMAMIASPDLPYSIRNVYNGIYRLTGTFPVGALSEGPADLKTHKKMKKYFSPSSKPDSSFDTFNTSAGVFYDDAEDFVCQESTISGQGAFLLMLALASKV